MFQETSFQQSDEKDYRIIQKVVNQPGLSGNDYKVAALYKSLNSYPLRTDRL